MKALVHAAAVMVVAIGVSASSGSGFDGTWTAKVPGPSGQGGLPVTFAFKSGDAPSGTVTVQGGETYDLVNVKIKGDTIAFQVEGEEQNLYSGHLSGDQIKMQVAYRSHENGTRVWSFMAMRAASTSSQSRLLLSSGRPVTEPRHATPAAAVPPLSARR